MLDDYRFDENDPGEGRDMADSIILKLLFHAVVPRMSVDQRNGLADAISAAIKDGYALKEGKGRDAFIDRLQHYRRRT